MTNSLDYTITIPPSLYNNAITTPGSPNNNHWLAMNALNTISSLCASQQMASSSYNATRISGFFRDLNLCQRIAQIWQQFRDAISDFFAIIYRWISAPFAPARYPIINEDISKETLQKIYWGLGKENKWRECIDARYHNLGKYVFDRGTHAGTVEPGFVGSMEKSFEFIHYFVNSEINADWYLLLHKQTCAHFNGDPTAFLMGQEKVGVFRGSDDHIRCGLTDVYALTSEGRAEFEALDRALKTEFGDSYGLGEMSHTNPCQTTTILNYKTMSREQIRRIFNKFLTEFYHEVKQATTADQKLWAIAKLHQRLEWLHPVRDGTARTSTALLNKFLTDYGFHPALLEYPHVSTSYGLAQWKQYLQNGLIKWEQEHARLNSTG
jgi:hypothetical protein